MILNLSHPYSNKVCLIQIVCLIVLSTQLFAQAPQITSFSPAAGNAGTAVTITGNNFSSTPENNIVYFGAVKAGVIAASNTSLIVSVPSGATYQPITVTTNNYTAYSAKPFVKTFAGGNISSLSKYTDFITGTTTDVNPKNTCIVDLDNDGWVDLVTNNFYANTISIFKNKSYVYEDNTIEFIPRVDYSTDTNPSNVSTGDLDGDGKLDLVIPNFGDGSISILKNISTPGSITFATKIKYYTGQSPRIASISDFDGDGKPDIAIVNEHSATISLLRNTTTGSTITFASKVDFYTESNPRDLRISDIDNDGKTDLICTNYGSGSITIFKNASSLGNLSFYNNYTINVGGAPRSCTTADFDGDGKDDLAIANYSNSSVAIYKNLSTSASTSFNLVSTFSSVNNAYGITAGDIDGDSKPDLAIGNNTESGGVTLIKNNSTIGNFSFALTTTLSTGKGTTFVTIGNFNNDAFPELISSNYFTNTISLLTNSNPLPLDLIHFDAKIQNGGIMLKWNTLNERNTSNFIIEHSINKEFSNVGTVKANASAKYTFLHNTSYYEKENYYRLRIVDNNGEFTYSDIITVKPEIKVESYVVYPNPSNSTFTITHPASGSAIIKLFNSEGRLIKSTPVTLGATTTNLDISLIPAGIYTLIWTDQNDQIVKKLIKE